GHITDEYLSPNFRGYRPEHWNYWEEFGITKEEFFKYYTKAWNKVGYDYFTAVRYTYTNSHKLFKTLHKYGYRISVITKRNKHTIMDTVEYLNTLEFHYDTFTVITDS